MNNSEIINAGLAQFGESRLAFEEVAFHAKQVVRCATDALEKLSASQACLERLDYSSLDAAQISNLNILVMNLNGLKETMTKLLPPDAPKA